MGDGLTAGRNLEDIAMSPDPPCVFCNSTPASSHLAAVSGPALDVWPDGIDVCAGCLQSIAQWARPERAALDLMPCAKCGATLTAPDVGAPIPLRLMGDCPMCPACQDRAIDAAFHSDEPALFGDDEPR